MISWGIIIFLGLLGFLFGYKHTGIYTKPKHAGKAFILKIKSTRYHIHHWIHSFAVLGILAALAYFDIIHFGHALVKYPAAFVGGYGVQGLFCKDAFKIKNYNRHNSY